MSGGENERFIEQKEAYLNTHFLLWRDHQSLVGKGIYEFDLKVDRSAQIQSTGGAAVTACVLTPMSGRGKKAGRYTHGISAYYLPFQPNRAFHHTLTDDVDFCFTPTLNGCTFVVGGGATPLISHYNYVDDPTSMNPTVDQGKIDRHILARHGGGATVLRRADYKVGAAIDYKVTIVGIRTGGAWNFYYQRRAEDLQFVPGKGSSLVTIAVNQAVQMT